MFYTNYSWYSVIIQDQLKIDYTHYIQFLSSGNNVSISIQNKWHVFSETIFFHKISQRGYKDRYKNMCLSI